MSRQSPTFPPVDRALEDPNGLLAVGGALTTEWLTLAYERGIFPWFDDDEGPILWWSPDPRTVLRPDQVRISRSLLKRLRNAGFTVTADTVFSEVIAGCAAQRTRGSAAGHGTWITSGMLDAYVELHQQGLAHSIEVWEPADDSEPRLVGGLYGVSLGRMFFGESMFSRVPDASKIALCHLARQLLRWEFWLMDCQMSNPHLTSMGAVEIPRREFIALVERNAREATRPGPWVLDPVAAHEWRRQS